MIISGEESVVISPTRGERGDRGIVAGVSPGRGRGRLSVLAPTAGGALLASKSPLLVTSVAGQYAASGKTLAWSDADVASGNRFASTGREILMARNTSGTPQLVTVISVPDARIGRSQDQVLTIEAGDVAIFGPFPTNGWQQTDGYIWVLALSTAVKLSIITGF